LKKVIFFSGPMIRFLRRHMMGRVDEVYLNTKDLFSHLKSIKEDRLNFAIEDEKVVFARVHPNANHGTAGKTADWALSKHALIAGRKDVYVSGEVWYDEKAGYYMINDDSGTYEPEFARAEAAGRLVSEIFNINNVRVIKGTGKP